VKTTSFLLETAVALGVISLFFLFLPEFKLHPYYFWLVTLMMAVRYGVVAGVVSGTCSAILFSTLLYASLDKKALETFWDLKYLLEPALFILMGGLVGQISQEKIYRIFEFKERNNQLQKTLFQIEKERALLEKAKNELEKRIVGELTTVTTLYETAKRLESFKLEDIYAGALQILSDHLEVTQSSLYMLENGLLTLKTTYRAGGAEGEAPSPRPQFTRTDDGERPSATGPGRLTYEEGKAVSKTEGLIGIAFETKKMISIREALTSHEFSTLKGGPLMAGPLVKKDGSVMGILTIEKLSFLRFTPSTMKMFSIILDWLSSSLENALYFQTVKARNIQDEIVGCYTYDYFKQRLREEFLRAKKYALPLSVLVLKLKEVDSVEVSKQLSLLKSIYLILKHQLRDIDLISQYESRYAFGMMLPTVQGEELQKIKTKIVEEIHSYGFKPFQEVEKELEFVISESSFSPKMQSEIELLNMLM